MSERKIIRNDKLTALLSNSIEDNGFSGLASFKRYDYSYYFNNDALKPEKSQMIKSARNSSRSSLDRKSSNIEGNPYLPSEMKGTALPDEKVANAERVANARRVNRI